MIIYVNLAFRKLDRFIQITWDFYPPNIFCTTIGRIVKCLVKITRVSHVSQSFGKSGTNTAEKKFWNKSKFKIFSKMLKKYLLLGRKWKLSILTNWCLPAQCYNIFSPLCIGIIKQLCPSYSTWITSIEANEIILIKTILFTSAGAKTPYWEKL